MCRTLFSPYGLLFAICGYEYMILRQLIFKVMYMISRINVWVVAKKVFGICIGIHFYKRTSKIYWLIIEKYSEYFMIIYFFSIVFTIIKIFILKTYAWNALIIYCLIILVNSKFSTKLGFIDSFEYLRIVVLI